MIATLDIILPDGERWKWYTVDSKPDYNNGGEAVRSITKGRYPGVFNITDWHDTEWEVQGNIYILRYEEAK